MNTAGWGERDFPINTVEVGQHLIVVSQDRWTGDDIQLSRVKVTKKLKTRLVVSYVNGHEDRYIVRDGHVTGNIEGGYGRADVYTLDDPTLPKLRAQARRYRARREAIQAMDRFQKSPSREAADAVVATTGAWLAADAALEAEGAGS